jgi:nucleoside 2-deoxyribosyltransferase
MTQLVPAVGPPKPFVFVLMPFRETDGFPEVYEEGIQPAAVDAGAYCERVDEQNFDGSIVERIYNQIAKADVIVADMSGKTPNVFYETGYAHALGKRTILLTRVADEIPFNLKHYPHVAYSTARIARLREELADKLLWAIQNPDRTFIDPTTALAFRIAGEEISDRAQFVLPFSNRMDPASIARAHAIPLSTRIAIDVQNQTRRPFDASGIQVGLLLPQWIAGPLNRPDVIRVSPDTALVLFANLAPFLPGSWQSLSVIVPNKLLQGSLGQPLPFGLQLFTEFGTRTIDFSLIFKDSPPGG